MNWKERIEKAEKRGKFTEKDVELANTFATCAMGEKTKGKHSFYLTRKGQRLGMDFFIEGVDMDNIKETRRIYNKIQRATMESLIRKR